MIEYKNIFVTFNGKKILKDFNLKINTNDKVVISGKSGAGKTTIFNLLLGFLSPDKGEIIFDEEKIDAKTIWNIRRKIAYVSQDIRIGRGPVIDIINNYLKLKSNTHIKFDKSKLNNLLKKFSLTEEILNKDELELSGGERQRIAIIISILLERKVFLLDEITSALDHKLKQTVINFFSNNKGYTVISISHDKEWLKKPGIKNYSLEKNKWIN